MTRTRTLIGIGLAVATLALFLAIPAPAGAGITMLGIDYECDTETGDYNVFFDLVNGSGADQDITVLDYDVDGEAQTAPTFIPNPIAGFGSSEAVTNLPGSTTSIFIELELDDGFGEPFIISAEQTLEGDCEPPATITTTTTQTTTSQAAAAEAVTLQPAFTG